MARASRARGEETRQRILDATLEVIAEYGVKGVTHRAVATRAGVQLSLTTYYFKSLNDLIEQAFESFRATGMRKLEPLWSQIFERMETFDDDDLARPRNRAEIATWLTDVTTDHVYWQVTENRTWLAVEQAFFHESSLDPQLTEAARRHQQRHLEPMIDLCRVVNQTETPQIDAELLLGTIIGLEHAHLRVAVEAIDREHIRQRLGRQIEWWLGVGAA